MKTNRFKKKGFTLVETIVVIFIFTILALGVTTLFTHIFINSRDRLSSIDVVDQARLVATSFTNEIRVASVGSDGSYPLSEAGDSQIIFYSNYSQNNGEISRIRYYVATSTLYKGTVVPTGSPLSYNLSNEKIRVVQNNLASTSTPIFYYYDGDYTGSSTPLSQPININQVKYAKINLTVLKKNSLNNMADFDITAGASIRNLKTNLGN